MEFGLLSSTALFEIRMSHTQLQSITALWQNKYCMVTMTRGMC